MTHGMSNRYSSPYYRSQSKEYFSPSVSDIRYSSPYRNDERDVYNASRGHDIYSRDHGSPMISRNMSIATNDLDKMLDKALGRGYPPPPPPHDPPLGSPRYRSPSPVSRRYNNDIYNTITSSSASRPYYRPREEISAPMDSVGYGYRSSTPYRSIDHNLSRDPSLFFDRDDASHVLRQMSFERGVENPYRSDPRSDNRNHIDESRIAYHQREISRDAGDDYYYRSRDAPRYDIEREYVDDWSHRYERDTRLREEHLGTSKRISYDTHYYDHGNSLSTPFQRPYEDQRATDIRYNSPLPSSPVSINDVMNTSYKSTPKEINIPMQTDYSTMNHKHEGGQLHGNNTLGRKMSLHSARSISSKVSVLSTWHGDDVVLLPKGHQASEAAVAATAAASLIADDSSRICGFDAAADRISDFVKPGTGKDALSPILSTAVLGSPLQNHSHVPLSYTNMQENIKRDLLVTATVNATRDKKIGSLPLDAYQFWSRCTLLVATAILKTGSTNTQLAHAAAETVMLHGIGTIHKDWKSTAEEDLKVVANAVYEVVSSHQGGDESIASVASVALLSEGSKTLAIERIRESDVQKMESQNTREIPTLKNEYEKPPIVRPKVSNYSRKKIEENNMDGIESIRNTGSLMDKHSSDEEEDQHSAGKDISNQPNAISRTSSGINHENKSVQSNSRYQEQKAQALQKNKALEQKRGEIAERISRIQQRAAANHDMPSVLGHIETLTNPNNHNAAMRNRDYTEGSDNTLINRTLYGSNYDSRRSNNARAGSQNFLTALLDKMSCTADPGEFYEETNVPGEQNSSLRLNDDWETLESVVEDRPTSIMNNNDAAISIPYAKPYPLMDEKSRRSLLLKVPSTSMKSTAHSVASSTHVPNIVDGNDAFSVAVEKGLPPENRIKKLSLTPSTRLDNVESSNDVLGSKPETDTLPNQKVIKKSRFKLRLGKKPEKA